MAIYSQQLASDAVRAFWTRGGHSHTRQRGVHSAQPKKPCSAVSEVKGNESNVEPSTFNGCPDVCLNPVRAIDRHALTAARVVTYPSY